MDEICVCVLVKNILIHRNTRKRHVVKMPNQQMGQSISGCHHGFS
jgi:hypothetical protein